MLRPLSVDDFIESKAKVNYLKLEILIEGPEIYVKVDVGYVLSIKQEEVSMLCAKCYQQILLSNTCCKHCIC